MVKAAIRLERTRSAFLRGNVPLRGREDTYGHEGGTFVIEGRTPCKTPGRERAARAAADDVSPEPCAARGAGRGAQWDCELCVWS